MLWLTIWTSWCGCIDWTHVVTVMTSKPIQFIRSICLTYGFFVRFFFLPPYFLTFFLFMELKLKWLLLFLNWKLLVWYHAHNSSIIVTHIYISIIYSQTFTAYFIHHHFSLAVTCSEFILWVSSCQLAHSVRLTWNTQINIT